MKIQEALKETGKARKIVDTDNYAKLDVTDRLYWHGIEDDNKNSPVQMISILSDDWQPYHPKEEIRPKEAGELWYFVEQDGKDNGKCMTYLEDGVLRRVWEHGARTGININWQIHNQNGWTRIHPPVPDENVEKEIFEGVTWHREDHDRLMCASGKHGFNTFGHLQGKPSMTMELTWPKDKT